MEKSIKQRSSGLTELLKGFGILFAGLLIGYLVLAVACSKNQECGASAFVVIFVGAGAVLYSLRLIIVGLYRWLVSLRVADS